MIRLLAIFVASLIIFGFFNLSAAQSNWLDPSWKYRRPVAISNPSGAQIKDQPTISSPSPTSSTAGGVINAG